MVMLLLVGVLILGLNRSSATATDGSGYYELKVPPGWSGRVTVSNPQRGFDPPSRAYSSGTADHIYELPGFSRHIYHLIA